MRLRRKGSGEAALAGMPGVLDGGADPAAPQGGWAAVFGREADLHVEIGMGKGDFILAAARRKPDVDFIGVERVQSVLYAAAVKNRDRPLPNLRFLPVDAGELERFFSPGQIARIYLHFSDPWPKTRHQSRRLTAEGKLAMYKRLLKAGGQIHMKTDQEALFAFSLRALIQGGWSVGKITRDLYHSGWEGNIPTEYERRFTAMGQPIYRLEAWNP